MLQSGYMVIYSYVIHCIYKLYLYIRAGFETKNFSSLEEFTRWKESEEESTHIYFVQRQKVKKYHMSRKKVMSNYFVLAKLNVLIMCIQLYIIRTKESPVRLLS